MAAWCRSGRLALLILLALVGSAGCSRAMGRAAGEQTAVTSTSSWSAAPVDSNDVASSGAPEKTQITLGLLPLIDVAPVYIGIEEGLFEREGLTIDIQPVQGGAAAIPAMVAGELDLTMGAYPSTMSGVANGLDLRIIAEANRASEGFSNLVALPDSGLEGNVAGLEGRRVGLNTFANIAELTTRSVIEGAGADYSKVEAVEIPFPEMVPAMQRGELDAIFAVEPFDTIAQSSLGAVVVTDPYIDETEALPVAGYYATGNFAANFPNTTAAFQRALIAATDIAVNDPDRVVEVLPTYSSLDAEAAANVTQPEFTARIDQGEIQRIVDLMVDYGFLEEPIDLDDIVVPTPEE
jgi:ABC-type nitrate/sulfonate/bicarbonate transport system substrate-binding protein